MKSYLLALVFMLSALSVRAETTATDPMARLAAMRKVADGLVYQKGEITLKGGLAKIHLPEHFRYLDSDDSGKVLGAIWGNPHASGGLGMIVPEGFDPLAGDSWAAVLGFDEDGYVKDDDAAKIDYIQLLKEMQEGTAEASKQRQKEGYPSVSLVGWAAAPHYDATSHKLYWAKEIQFGDNAEHTLNYNIRMLGRRGVLVVNVVASLADLKQVERATPDLVGMINFQDGHRYADFSEDTDKVATYGIAALVAGGIAAKIGMFKGLWIAVLALKKFIIMGLVVLGGFLRKLFTRKKPTGLTVPPSN